MQYRRGKTKKASSLLGSWAADPRTSPSKREFTINSYQLYSVTSGMKGELAFQVPPSNSHSLSSLSRSHSQYGWRSLVSFYHPHPLPSLKFFLLQIGTLEGYQLVRYLPVEEEGEVHAFRCEPHTVHMRHSS